MLKKWKKTIKLSATTIIVLIYITIGFFYNETLKGEEKNKKNLNFVFESVTRYPGTIKTIIGYSKEFRLKKELEGRIECEPKNYPGATNRKSIWTYHEKFGLKVYSAYYDQRLQPENHVRIIGLLPKNSSFYCQIWYQNNDTITSITHKAEIQKIWSKNWGPKNKTCEEDYPAIISCLAPIKEVVPSWVSFVDESCSGDTTFVKINPPPRVPEKKNFVICVKPLKNIDSHILKEWLDINRVLGAEKIIMYEWIKGILKELTSRILVKEKFSTPRPGRCRSRSFEESVWYKRKMEIIAYNDCFYSNLYHTKFVIPLDVDEIIVPKSGNNWFEAFHSHFLNGKLTEETKNSWPKELGNYASFSVQNAYFFSSYPKDAIIRSLMLPKRDQNVPKKLVNALIGKRSSRDENIFDRIVRSYRLSPNGDSVKSFVHVPNTLSVFNHYTFHVLGDVTRQFIFPENVLQLNHYRNSCDPILIDGCRDFLSQVVYDDTLEKFRRKKNDRLI